MTTTDGMALGAIVGGLWSRFVVRHSSEAVLLSVALMLTVVAIAHMLGVP